MRIGPYVLAAPTALAPMAGVTDRPFRMLCRRLGAGVAASEMLTADTRLWRSRKSQRRMNHEGEPSPRIVQLAGADPAALAEAARLNVDLGAEIIDLNMGCPAKKVFNRHCGSALLADEALVARILEAVVGAVRVPVTLKMRTGVDREHRNGVNIARIAASSGIAALAVHGRTRADHYNGEAEYATIRDIKSAVTIPVFANGDIDSVQKARVVLDFTRADGVMLGRAAHGAPWIFRAVKGFLSNGEAPAALARERVRDIIASHLTDLYDFYGEVDGVRFARKHLGWYLTSLPGSRDDRRFLMSQESTATQFACAVAWLDRWVDGTAEAA
ncbi:MAG TPA: tRNA dihydrouridine synthase DusB [Steroidobacteraceae bacterium]|nr:tRNA dihydrouridine synthase DusB [Steroidobacteraceae bacterium]HQW08861.1 tRNA dihydrouridine synthase DusB [Steroidobacteraceae bacterium]HQX47780.1 tRNA dihydrouridine synthase DusB [Steroidobacteraceae bacterium]HQX77101.1 tRNA dihydrouridine synthase DusB [Steroidobacteraceae bacterium]HQZ80981.1 tRNA dihydrouridine synthase DusB [Steroidobacteraceae bacterium]